MPGPIKRHSGADHRSAQPDEPAEEGDKALALSPRRIGIIINPRSHGNRNGWAQLDALLARNPKVARAAPANPADLVRTLKDFAAATVDLLVISGGDGTLRDVLSALPEAYPGAMPDVALLSAGNTNLVARALGSPRNGHRLLERLLKAAETGGLRRRTYPFLEVSWVGQPDRQPIRGFFLGAAAFVESKRVADTDMRRYGLHQGLAVFLTTALTALRTLSGSGEKTGGPMQVSVDGGPPCEANRFLLLATTLDRLMLGIWPFWGGGGGHIRLLDVRSPPARLGAALLAVALRRPRPWMASNGYRSGRAHQLRIQSDQPFVLDGEVFDPGPHGILISSPGAVTFVCP